MRLLLLLFLGFSFSGIQAQIDSLVVTPNYKFAAGVYLTFEAFQHNQPDYLWDDLRTNLAFNPQTFMTQVEYIQPQNAGAEMLQLDSIWGICIEGIPFIRLPKAAVQKELITFAGLQVRGKICYYNYTSTVTRQVEITAYNPYNGRPFRQGVIDKTEDIVVEKMLDFETGVIVDYSQENLLKWIAEDEKLSRSVEELAANDLKKLFKSLLIYNDRHPVKIKQD